MKKHYNIPVFITHAGCQNDCVFCNQKIITGQPESSGEREIRETIEKFIGIIHNRIDVNPVGTEIAFFGGSFTGLEKTEMMKFLETANEYIEEYKIINGIRLSTRPDYISEEIIDILLKYRVKSIELGIQSMFDEVLTACKRGHIVKDTEKACGIIKAAGINLTGQMMLGLPESNRERDIETAKMLVNLGIDSARIYPAVVLQGTQLYDMYKRGEYEPLNLDEAVFRAKEIKKIFDSNNIEVLRMGLCSSSFSMEDINNSGNIIGAYHPAFGELVESEIIYDKLVGDISDIIINQSEINIRMNKKMTSKIVGQKRKNIERIKEKFNLKNIKIIEDDNINLYKIEIAES